MRWIVPSLIVAAGMALAACGGAAPEVCLPEGRVTVADSVVGTGQAATPFSTVSVIYVGRVAASGVVFDSTATPRALSLIGTIPGFRIGVGGNGDDIPPMRIGGRRIIQIPAWRGYAEFPPTSAIPVCADLVFDVTLRDL